MHVPLQRLRTRLQRGAIHPQWRPPFAAATTTEPLRERPESPSAPYDIWCATAPATRDKPLGGSCRPMRSGAIVPGAGFEPARSEELRGLSVDPPVRVVQVKPVPPRPVRDRTITRSARRRPVPPSSGAFVSNPWAETEFTEREHHHGRNMWVTRKGAIRARTGDLGVIPGSMGTRSYIVEGRGVIGVVLLVFARGRPPALARPGSPRAGSGRTAGTDGRQGVERR